MAKIRVTLEAGLYTYSTQNEQGEWHPVSYSSPLYPKSIRQKCFSDEIEGKDVVGQMDAYCDNRGIEVEFEPYKDRPEEFESLSNLLLEHFGDKASCKIVSEKPAIILPKILITGRPKAGKSTLARSIIHEIGATNDAEEDPDYQVYHTERGTIYDVHTSGDGVSALQRVCDISERLISEKEVTAVWYCFTGDRIQEKEEEIIQKLNSKCTEANFLLVLTQFTGSKEEEQQMVQKLTRLLNVRVKAVLAEAVKIAHGQKVLPFGMYNLIDSYLEV